MTTDRTLADLCRAWQGGDPTAGPVLADALEEVGIAWEASPYGWHYDSGLGVIAGCVGMTLHPDGPPYFWEMNLWGTPAKCQLRGRAAASWEAQDAAETALRRALRGDV